MRIVLERSHFLSSGVSGTKFVALIIHVDLLDPRYHQPPPPPLPPSHHHLRNSFLQLKKKKICPQNVIIL